MPIENPQNETVDQALEDALASIDSSQPQQTPEEIIAKEYLPRKGMSPDEVSDILSEATKEDAGDAPEPTQAYVFHTSTSDLITFVNTKARDHAKTSMHGHIQHKRGDEGHNVEVKFVGGRFVTFDKEFAELLQFCIKTWPDTYGRIYFGHTSHSSLSARIERIKAESAKRQLGSMVGVEGEDDLLLHAQRANEANQTQVAEALLTAAENIQTAAKEYSFSG